MKALNKHKSMWNMSNIKRPVTSLIMVRFAICLHCCNCHTLLIFTQYISYIVMSNMLNQAQKILLVFIQSNWMYVEHVEHIKACNFLNNGPICNPLALLELSYSALFTQYISFILMLNMLNQAQKILLVFIQNNWMYVEHVEHTKACNFLNNGPICNLLTLLELSYSALFTQYISFILILNMSNQVQKILLVFLQSNWMYVEQVFK